MSVYVVDASVALKWFVVEPYTDDALRLRNPAHALHVPALFDVELTNILWKKLQRTELSFLDAQDIVDSFHRLPITRHPILPLLRATLKTAYETQRTAYDCLYLVLAISLGGRMVTADQRFFNSLSRTEYAPHLCWVEDIP